MNGLNPPTKPDLDNNFWQKIGLALAVLLLGFAGGALAVRLYDQNLIDADSGLSQTIIDGESQTINNIVEDVSPSVVSIQTQTVQRGGFFLDQLFTQEGAGTGIIVSADGLVLTNRHVIPEGVSRVNVVMADGTVHEDVEVVDRDQLNDLAFLKIDGVDNLKAAALGDSSDMAVGDRVLAVGNALGEFTNTVTSGIISGIGRPVVASDGTSSEQLQNLFQTDAAINPGNSGGPLINLQGEVIGVNTAVAGGAENIGFAIPINDVKPVLSSVLESGQIVRPYLGVRYVSLTPSIAKEAGVKVDSGAYLIGDATQPAIIDGSPADQAGLKDKDVVTKVNGQIINDQNPLASRLGELKPGDIVVLTVQRGDNELTLEATLGTLPDN